MNLSSISKWMRTKPRASTAMAVPMGRTIYHAPR